MEKMDNWDHTRRSLNPAYWPVAPPQPVRHLSNSRQAKCSSPKDDDSNLVTLLPESIDLLQMLPEEDVRNTYVTRDLRHNTSIISSSALTATAQLDPYQETGQQIQESIFSDVGVNINDLNVCSGDVFLCNQCRDSTYTPDSTYRRTLHDSTTKGARIARSVERVNCAFQLPRPPHTSDYRSSTSRTPDYAQLGSVKSQTNSCALLCETNTYQRQNFRWVYLFFTMTTLNYE